MLTPQKKAARQNAMRTLFPLWDLDGSGTVDVSEIQTVLASAVDGCLARGEDALPDGLLEQFTRELRVVGQNDLLNEADFTTLMALVTMSLSSAAFTALVRALRETLQGLVASQNAGNTRAMHAAVQKLFKQWDPDNAGEVEFDSIAHVLTYMDAFVPSALRFIRPHLVRVQTTVHFSSYRLTCARLEAFFVGLPIPDDVLAAREEDKEHDGAGADGAASDGPDAAPDATPEILAERARNRIVLDIINAISALLTAQPIVSELSASKPVLPRASGTDDGGDGSTSIVLGDTPVSELPRYGDEELRAEVCALFPKWDVDRSGTVSLAEIVAVLERGEDVGSARVRTRSEKKLLTRLQLLLTSVGEVTELSLPQFEELFLRWGRGLSDSEFRAMLRSISQLIEQQTAETIDSRKKLAICELFDAIDTDGSGSLDPNEFMKVVQASDTLLHHRWIRKNVARWQARLRFLGEGHSLSLRAFHDVVHDIVRPAGEEHVSQSDDEFIAILRDVRDAVIRVNATSCGDHGHGELRPPDAAEGRRPSFSDAEVTAVQLGKRNALLALFRAWDADGDGVLGVRDLNAAVRFVDSLPLVFAASSKSALRAAARVVARGGDMPEMVPGGDSVDVEDSTLAADVEAMLEHAGPAYGLLLQTADMRGSVLFSMQDLKIVGDSVRALASRAAEGIPVGVSLSSFPAFFARTIGDDSVVLRLTALLRERRAARSGAATAAALGLDGSQVDVLDVLALSREIVVQLFSRWDFDGEGALRPRQLRYVGRYVPSLHGFLERIASQLEFLGPMGGVTLDGDFQKLLEGCVAATWHVTASPNDPDAPSAESQQLHAQKLLVQLDSVLAHAPQGPATSGSLRVKVLEIRGVRTKLDERVALLLSYEADDDDGTPRRAWEIPAVTEAEEGVFDFSKRGAAFFRSVPLPGRVRVRLRPALAGDAVAELSPAVLTPNKPVSITIAFDTDAFHDTTCIVEVLWLDAADGVAAVPE